ncbi:inositol monophosphatase [Candidatus Woesearchaeota archaeon]|nr:inositol monophosphatase [Candidatus Woesearchaeota archaeon]
MNEKLLNKQFSVGLQAVKEASKIAMQYYKNLPNIQRKASGSVVTLADFAAEDKMFSIIERNFPYDSLHGEESGLQKKKTKYTWVADPIDGTSNYMHGLPMFGVSLALLENNKPIIGFVSLPFYQEIFYGIKRKGSYLIKNKKKFLLSVSKTKEFKDSLLIISARARSDYATLEKLIRIFIPYCNYRSFGSVVFNLMQLAKGNVQAVISHGLHPWDNAASFVITEEAGAKITNFQGKKWNLNEKSFLITNNILHKEFLDIIKKNM